MARYGRTEPGSSATKLARMLRAPCLAVIPLLAGCYGLVPINPEAAAPPMRVRAYLSPEATERITPVLGVARAEVDGRVVERTPEGIFLEVTSARSSNEFRSETLTQRILLEREDLTGLQRRQLDRTRTAALVGIGAAVVGALIYDQLSGEGGGNVVGPPPGPPEARIPLIRIKLR